MDDTLLNELEAAEKLRVTVHALRRWRQGHGEGPRFARLGKAIRYDARDIDQFIESRKTS